MTSVAPLTLLFLFIATTCTADDEVLSIVEVVNGHIVTKKNNLDRIFAQIPDKETEVAVISIAGELRTGKSFLLNFFLQYLNYRSSHAAATLTLNDVDAVANNLQSHPWLRDLKANSGFHYRPGTVRDTIGISMWSKPFLITKPGGKKLAVILMDSQGLYDHTTSADDNVRIFTIVSLLSSSLILNTRANIDTNKLSQLKYFMEYAKLGSTVSKGSKPFQRLTFLLRDFSLGETYGWKGGQDALNLYLQPHEGQSSDTKDLSEALKSGFTTMDCFASPFPGNAVTRQSFDGSLRNIDPEFLSNLENFVVDITEQAEGKTSLSMTLTAKDYVSYVKGLVDMFNKKPSPHELLRLHERALILKVHNKIEEQVMKYTETLLTWIEDIDKEYLLNTGIAQITNDIIAQHNSVMEAVVAGFQNDKMSSVLVHYGDEKEETAIEFLAAKISDRFKSNLQKRMERIALNRKEHLENEKKQEKMRIERETADAKRIKQLDDQLRELSNQNSQIEKRMEEMKHQEMVMRQQYDDWMRESEDDGFWGGLIGGIAKIVRAFIPSF